jgi:hypothetical protein
MFLFNIETSSKPKKTGIAAQRGKVGLQLGQGWLGKAREAIENGGKGWVQRARRPRSSL